ncbi:cyclin-dependent kinases regulatory subunit 1 isoform X1 [Chamaea fasciata]|uniref:cyclin-dependent kinases regulatory subunit 1 isoform X1 n=1 Tax=Chamaea fasciata TaxID=190680 RepID=UPI00336A04F5
MAHKQIYYSDKYDDEEFEYRAPHPALPTAIAQETRKVSGPWSAEAPSPSTLRKHLPPPRHSWGLHPLTLDAAWVPFWRLGPGSGGPSRCCPPQSFNKVMFGSCLSAVPGGGGEEGEGVPIPRSLSYSRGGLPEVWGQVGPPMPTGERAVETELRQHPPPPSMVPSPQVPPLGQ